MSRASVCPVRSTKIVALTHSPCRSPETEYGAGKSKTNYIIKSKGNKMKKRENEKEQDQTTELQDYGK